MTPQFNSASPDTHEDELLRPSSSEPGLESDNRLLSVSMPDDRFLQLAESQGSTYCVTNGVCISELISVCIQLATQKRCSQKPKF
jgi:hypothetical protein